MAKSAFKFVNQTKLPKLKNVAIAAADRALYKYASFIYVAGRSLIRKRKKASKPGTPFSRGTGVLKKALGVDRDTAAGTATIGYRFAHNAADAHELGGLNQSNKKRYPRRSVLEPALAKGIADFEKKFKDDFQKYFKM